MSDQLYGYLAVLGAIFFFGSIGVMIKSKKLAEAKVDPMVFQLYYSVAIFISSWLVLSYNSFVFTYWGIVGAALWVPASILSIFAIKYAGLSISQGIWSGSSIIVSFLWGAIFYPMIDPHKDDKGKNNTDEVKSFPLSAVALFVLCVGILGLSLSGTQTIADMQYKFPFIDSLFARCRKPTRKSKLGINSGGGHYATIPGAEAHSDDEECVDEEDDLIEIEEQPLTIKERLFGMFCAIALGIPNGSMLVPLRLSPADAQGINYMVSFGIGVVCVTPVLALIYFVLKREVPVFHPRVALVPGLLAGFVWNLGNFSSIYATLYLGLTIGFPLTQVALLVAGLYGIFFFKEITSWFAVMFFFLSAGVLLGGAALLSVYG
jgi:glucose uptake protein GlcU